MTPKSVVKYSRKLMIKPKIKQLLSTMRLIVKRQRIWRERMIGEPILTDMVMYRIQQTMKQI